MTSRRGSLWRIAVIGVSGILLVGGVAIWLLVFRAVVVPDLQGKSVAEAVRLAVDADLKLVQEERQVNGAPVGVVVEQAPPGGSKVRHGATVKVMVAVEAKPTSIVDLSGYWDSSSGARYDVIQEGADVFWRMKSSSPNVTDEPGSATVDGNRLASSKGSRTPMGRVARTDDRGLAQVIRWDDGVVWFRTEAEGADLVRHYQLEKYDRATVLEAIKKDRD